MWGKDGTRPKSAAELVNKGNGLACEILALGTLMYVQKNLDTICSPTGGSVAEGFQRKNFSLHVSCISLSIFKVFCFFFVKAFPFCPALQMRRADVAVQSSDEFSYAKPPVPMQIQQFKWKIFFFLL